MILSKFPILKRLFSPEPKLFFIGFNKCGTKTLTFFLWRNGYNAAHTKTRAPYRCLRRFLAKIIDKNVRSGRPVLAGLLRYQVFSDLVYTTANCSIEANAYFREFHRDHPDAYFVFNDRPLDNWIRSRVAHVNRRTGSFLDRQAMALGLSEDDTIARWREMYTRHKSEVLDYFRGNPRFMIFNIEHDQPESLVEFLADDFSLDLSKWEHLGQTSLRPQRLQRKPTQ